MLALLLALLAYGPSNQLDINRADLDEIRRLPVSGDVAEGIFSYMQEYGRLGSVYELMRVDGMSSAKFEELKPLLYVSEPVTDEYRVRKVHSIQRRLASEDGPTAAAVEQWQDMLLTPLNVNRARVADLLVLDNVSLVDAVAVVKHLGTGRTITSRRDLAARVRGLSNYGYRNMRDFVSYDDVAWSGFGGNYRMSFESDDWWETEFAAGEFSSALTTLDEDTTEFREAGFTAGEVDFFRQRLLAEQADLAEAGNRSLLRNRLRVRAGSHLALGGWLDQDFAEPALFDEYKGALEVREFGPVRRVFVGDYRLTIAQGLLLDNTNELRARTSDRPEGIFNDLSSNRGFGFRGGAAELGHGRFGLLGFYSTTRRDAILNPDSTVNYYITSTPRFSAYRNTLGEEDYGGSFRLDLSDLLFVPTGTRLGFNALGIGYDRDFNPSARLLDLPGDVHVLNDPNYTRLDTGRTRLFYGADFRTVIENLSFEGELAMKPSLPDGPMPGANTAIAALAKARVQYNYLYVTALWRHYDLGYDNPYNRGYTEQLRFEDTQLEKSYRLIDPAFAALQDFPMPKAEEGLLIETRYQISRAITFTRAYVDIWRNLAWGVNNVRFQGEVEWRPVYPLRIRFKQKVQSKGLPKPVLSTRSLTTESSIRVMASLSNHDYLSAELREGRIYLTPNVEYGDKASMSGNFLAVQWDHNFSDDFNAELGVAVWMTRAMSQWIFEDTGIDFLEGDGMKWYVAASDRISERLMVYCKARQKVSLYPRNGLGGDEGVHFPGSPDVVRDFIDKDNSFQVSLQVDVFW